MGSLPRARRLLLALAVLAASLGLGASASTGEEEGAVGSPEEVARAVDAALRSKDPDTRLAAFDAVARCTDRRCVSLLVSRLQTLGRAQADLAGKQARARAAIERLLEEKARLDQAFGKPLRGAREVQRHAEESRRLTRALDERMHGLTLLEQEHVLVQGQVERALRAMGELLGRLDASSRRAALEMLSEAWIEAREGAKALWFLDAVAPVEDVAVVGGRIVDLVEAAALSPRLRAAALRALAARGDPRVPSLAVPWLALDPRGGDWHLVAGAVEALRTAHVRDGIEPLIALLGREDLGRLREDVHLALSSLTGERHGPYRDVWARWWEAERASFQMPRAPSDVASTVAEGAGVTFYGIRTFSTGVLFVLDVSGSMSEAPRPGPDGTPRPARIEVARRELAGAVHGLEPTDRFGVILFHQRVLPWKEGVAPATEPRRREALAWALAQEPDGGTNVHDALEAAFRIAAQGEGRPAIDTVFFLTDGQPTAGVLQDPAAILQQVRAWSRTAPVRIHAVGIGEHDESFLRELARIGRGQYVRR